MDFKRGRAYLPLLVPALLLLCLEGVDFPPAAGTRAGGHAAIGEYSLIVAIVVLTATNLDCGAPLPQ